MSHTEAPDHLKTPMHHTHSILDSLLDQAWKLINQRAVSKAHTAINELNKRYPASSDGWYASSFLAFQLRDAPVAISSIKKAIELEPEQIKWNIHLAHCLLLINDKAQALSMVLKLSDKVYSDLSTCTELALVLNKLNCHDLSEQHYQQALKLSPGNSQILFNLASVQRYLGKIEDAENNFDKVIMGNPNDYEAYLQRSGLRKQTPDYNHIKQLEKSLKRGIKSPLGKTQVYYALSKELEDTQDYQKSFSALDKGASNRRKHMKYNVSGDVDTINSIIKTFDAQVFNQPATGFDNNEAIFVLGLPRTGSTLIERIIGCHTDVISAGELNNFAMVMMNECKKISATQPKTKQALVELTRHINFKSLGKNYIDSTRPDTGNTARFIDKLPLNSLYVGLIHLALPNAKIIHVKRHPLDTCYAIYKQLFTDGYPFSYSLDDLAEYYIAHHKLMAHWETVLPGVIHHVAYEDVINDIDKEAKDLIAYCDLDWQPQCVDFHNNKSASTTASASQVREPLYRKSMARWRNYEEQLAPLKLKLEQAGILCD
jgi:tetratricopeptide (TPR) repeat protein